VQIRGQTPGRRCCLVLLLAAAIAPAHGQQGTQDSRLDRGRQFLGLAPPADPAAASRGQALFAQNCAFCHGPTATGAEGPDLLRSTVVLHDEKGETLGPVVLKGRPDKGMPSFAGLTPPQIYDLAEFLHQRVEQAANRFGYKIQNIVTGDAKAGQQFFIGEGHCSSCHSPAGDLAHIASKFEPPDLQAQFLYPAQPAGAEKASSPYALRVKITLATGETVLGTVKRMDDFDISVWDASGAYRSWPLASVKVQIEDPLEGHRELLSKYTDADMHNVLAYLETLK
jgi:cytochrome c oxidase cbb3-type subunit 3